MDLWVLLTQGSWDVPEVSTPSQDSVPRIQPALMWEDPCHLSPVPVPLKVSWLPPGTLTCFPQGSSHWLLSLLAQGRNEPGKTQKT